MNGDVPSLSEVEAYRVNGHAFVERALTPGQRRALLHDVDARVEESRRHTEPYGETMVARARFDLEADHTSEAPALRRVASPVELSGAYLDVMRDTRPLDAVPVRRPAGSPCLLHTSLLHGSAPNRSDRPRTRFICEYRAEDSRALQGCQIASRHHGEAVRGVRTNRVRCSAYAMEYPEVPEYASCFSQQASA